MVQSLGSVEILADWTPADLGFAESSLADWDFVVRDRKRKVGLHAARLDQVIVEMGANFQRPQKGSALPLANH